MTTCKLASFYLLIIVFAIHDKIVEGIESFSVNASVFYFTGVHLFILFWMWVAYVEMGRGRGLVLMLSLPILLRLILNLMSFGKSYQEYDRLVNNQIIDHATWIGLIIGTVIIWHGYITSRRL